MRLSLLRRSSPVEGPEPQGTARLDKRTKDLTKRLKRGEVAVIDHLDIDRIAAEGLVACSPSAVVNCAASISGRYPNLGPEILVEAGIPVLDAVGPDVFGRLDEGDHVVLDGDRLMLDGEEVAKGSLLDIESVEKSMDEARAGLAVQLEAFASNTMEYLRQERDLLIDGIGVPDISTEIDGRHVLIVVRGYHYKEDLQTLRPYIREHRPVLIGVDGGADATARSSATTLISSSGTWTPSPIRHWVRRGGGRTRVSRRTSAWPRARRVTRRRPRRLPGDRHQRGRRDAPGRRQGCRA